MSLNYDCNVILQDVLKRRGIWSMELLDKIIKAGSIQKIEEIPEDIRRVFRCAGDISPEWHVRVQAQFQKWIDNAISKTCNFPNSATVEDIMTAYVLAWQLGCKGLTVYRDGSRFEQVLVLHKDAKKPKRKSSGQDKPLDSSFDQGLLPERQVTPPPQPLPDAAPATESSGKKRYRPANPAPAEKACPDCKSEANIQNKEGCITCVGCGWSKCM